MTAYYVDPDDGGTDSGTQANPWTSLQSAIDTVAAGDVIYARNTQTLGAAIDFDGTSGTAAAPIWIIGCDASWDVVGGTTRFVLDGDSAAANCADFNAMNYVCFVNVDFRNATDSGINGHTAQSTNILCVNCRFASNTNYGIDGNNSFVLDFVCSQCVFDSNSNGTYRVTGHFVACRFLNNTSYGIGYSYSTVCLGCVFEGNGTAGVQDYTDGNAFINCVFDGHSGTGDSGYIGWFSTETVVIGSRFSNNDTGVDLDANTVAYLLYCYADDTFGGSGDVIEVVDPTNTTTNTQSGSDTNDGYVTDEFNLDSGATLRSLAIEVPSA